MKKRLPAYLYQNKLSDEQRNLNNTAHNVFLLLTLIASYTPDKSTLSPCNIHRITGRNTCHTSPILSGYR